MESIYGAGFWKVCHGYYNYSMISAFIPSNNKQTGCKTVDNKADRTV